MPKSKQPGLQLRFDIGFRLMVALLLAVPMGMKAEDFPHYSFALSPSVWSAEFEGRIARHQGVMINASIDIDYEFFIPDNLDTLEFFSFAAQIGRWSFLADSQYVNQSNRLNSDLLAAVSGPSDQIIEGAIGYQIPSHENIELIAGGRIFSIYDESTPSLHDDSATNATWTDTFIGARIKYDLSDRWYASLRADIGGLNSRSDERYNVAAFVGYRLNEITTVELGYRQLSSESPEPGNNISMGGLGLGLGIRF